MNSIANRFLKYVSIDTQGNEQSRTCPSNENQRLLAELLKDELLELGITDVYINDKSFLYARIPSNTSVATPSIAFFAHLDTTPGVSGANIKPRVVPFEGEDIVLNQRLGIVLSPKVYPSMLESMGEELIVTDGTTLLGADGKAGIAEIMEAAKYIMEHPELEHGEVCIIFTPDEEIGFSTEFISMSRIPSKFGFTVDSGGLGEYNYESFNAATATVTAYGSSMHPGSAKNRMKNAILLAAEFMDALPANETPSFTSDYEGYYHVSDIRGGVDQCIMTYNIRDFDMDGFEERKHRMRKIVDYLNDCYGKDTFSLEIEDYYLNMKQKVELHPEIHEIVRKAMEAAGVEQKIRPIRGGTDGVTISYMGLPCPNLFAGGYNSQSIYEYISTQTMEKAVQVIVNVILFFAEHKY